MGVSIFIANHRWLGLYYITSHIKVHKEFWLSTLRFLSWYRAVDMKGLLIISFLVLHLLYAAKAQDECIRSTTSQVSVDVSWCSQPVIVTLPNSMVAGYCGNARCKSSHKTHSTPEQVVRSKCYLAIAIIAHVNVLLLTHCRML